MVGDFGVVDAWNVGSVGVSVGISVCGTMRSSPRCIPRTSLSILLIKVVVEDVSGGCWLSSSLALAAVAVPIVRGIPDTSTARDTARVNCSLMVRTGPANTFGGVANVHGAGAAGVFTFLSHVEGGEAAAAVLRRAFPAHGVGGVIGLVWVFLVMSICVLL